MNDYLKTYSLIKEKTGTISNEDFKALVAEAALLPHQVDNIYKIVNSTP